MNSYLAFMLRTFFVTIVTASSVIDIGESLVFFKWVVLPGCCWDNSLKISDEKEGLIKI